METEKAELEISPPSLADPVVAPEMEEGVNAEGEVSAKAQEEVPTVVPIPVPPPLEPTSPMPMPEPIPQPMAELVNESMAPVQTEEEGEIAITDQDVLFGRGGLTNRHIGNLRYRDIISIHRQDYVRAQKTEKPNVARRIVKAIRTGQNPGRFLRKGDDGKWHAVSDKEAAWKASQALREKSRWSSMKERNKRQASPSAAEIAVGSTIRNVAEETINTKTAQKRKAAEAEGEPKGDYCAVPEIKRGKIEFPVGPSTPPQLPAEDVPTEISHITVPPVVALGGTKQVGANYMLPSIHPVHPSDIFPKDEDVLFGRGGRTNHHPGNKRLRQIVNKYRDTYNQAKKVDKPKVSKLIVSALRSANPPSRFLRMNDETTLWEDVGDKRAAEKVSQTLREKDRDSKAESAVQRERSVAVRAEVFAAVAQAAQAAAAQATVAQTAPQAAAEVTPAAPLEMKMAHVEDVEDMQVEIPSPEKLAPLPPPGRLEI